MGWVTNAALLAVVGGLGAYLYLDQPDSPTKKKKTGKKRTLGELKLVSVAIN